jgi:hypothetical protein
MLPLPLRSKTPLGSLRGTWWALEDRGFSRRTHLLPPPGDHMHLHMEATETILKLGISSRAGLGFQTLNKERNGE